MTSGHRSLACIASCLVACFSTTALVTFVTLFATAVLHEAPIHKQALTAAVLDIIALATLLIFVICHTCTSRRILSWSYQRRWVLAPLVMLPFTVTMILSIYVLAWMNNNMAMLKTDGPIKQLPTLVAAAIAMWVISLVSLGIYFALCLRQESSLPDSVISTSDPLRSYIDVAEHKTHPLSMHTLTPSPKRPKSTVSDTPSSTLSASPMSSVRSSVQQFLRSGANSKNRLAQSKDSVHSDSMSERRPSDGFETWEVTSPTATTESTVSLAHLRAAHQQRLETIPGSRPVSPAHPLEGPFPEDIPEDFPLESPRQAYRSRSSSIASSTRGFPPFAPPMVRRPSAQQQDQSHIHPLFRSDSPVPPPAASPGTIVMASPFAGQVVNSDAAFGSRSRKGSALGSRPSSPNPSLIRASSALSLSRPNSSRSIRALAAQQMQRPRMVMSPSLGDLRAEHEKFVKSPLPVLHKRERSA